jgi:hypothetical protein
VISVEEIIQDPDMISPEPFTILRSQGQFVLGGFQSTTTAVPVFGPVHQASDKEIQMLAEADRVGAVRSFWANIAIYTTRGTVPVPSTHGEVPVGSGTSYTLSTTPPGEACSIYDATGLLLIDYIIVGSAVTFAASPTAPLYACWPVTAQTGQSASDILQFQGEQYRVSHVYRVLGSGYWRALAVRMDAS